MTTTPLRRAAPLRGRGRAGLRALAPMVNIHEFSPVPASVPAYPDPSSISQDAWQRLEDATFSVMHKIQPTVSSQHLRARIIDYLQRLFRLHHDGYQVISFGSVPFKTYLPDGDIDLTLFGAAISDENLENEVCAMLKSEEQRKNSDFEIKDIKYVPAEVKLVKCKVQNIAVDISVNQIGGPNKLHFLEKIDQNLGKNNLLRRSILLIKHWCYYESCILGAQRGLISTYALEILVLYVFHIFHKSLDGPLAVLYRFLDYYSKFDWDNKGISLFGPISLSSLPELVTEQPDTCDYGFLPREAFLKDCAEAFSVPHRNSDKNPQVFSKKNLNIVDPLKQNNNLGRSVSKGNFGRIRREFYIGACKLGKILQAPPCFSVNEINRFFRNTLNKADVLASSSDDVLLTANVNNDSVSPGSVVERINKGRSPNDSCDVLCNQFSYIEISDSSNHRSVKQNECNSVAEYKGIKSVSWGSPDSDATSHATTDSVSTRNRSDFSDASPSPGETCTLQSARDHFASRLFFRSENGRNVDVRDGTIPSHREMSAVWFVGRPRHYFEDTKHIKEYSGRSPSLLGHNAYTSSTGLVDGIATSNSGLTPKISQQGGTTNNIVPDLTGDFGIDFHNRPMYAQRYQQDNPNQLYYPMLAKNGAVSGPLHQTNYYHIAMRAHGTGTYFPDSNLLVDRPPDAVAVHANACANEHGTTALAAYWRPASWSPSSAPQQQPPPQPTSPSFAWPGEAHQGWRRHGWHPW